MGSAGGARALSRRAHLTAEFRGGPPTSKVVFSSTLEPPLSWVDTELVRGDAVEVVREMKRRDSRPMRTVGRLSLCRSLLGAGLVDRFRVVVFPSSPAPPGTDRIVDGYPDVALDLVTSRTFDGRLQLLEYVPRVLDGPPGTGGGPLRTGSSRCWTGASRLRPRAAGFGRSKEPSPTAEGTHVPGRGQSPASNPALGVVTGQDSWGPTALWPPPTRP
jgi:hypothetical protein